MDKSLFEKLTCCKKTLTLKQSVINNISRLLNCGGFLDDEVSRKSQLASQQLNSIYPNSLSSIIDQSLDNKELLTSYQKKLQQLILRFEPRIKNVKVKSLKSQGLQMGCNLKIELYEEEFEEHFVFNQDL